jgi:hypothetical protein
MRVYQVVVLAVVLGTVVPVVLHHQVHGVVNVHHAALAFFLWLNTIIAFWEICLFLRIDRIEADFARFEKDYVGRPLDRVKDFFFTKLRVAQIFSLGTWSEIWSTYALFDAAYADRKSFGFWIDTGNGFTTLLTSLGVLYGLTYQPVSARTLGIVMLLACYQMGYGAVVYFASYVFNKRYAGHSARDLAIFVGLSNGIWIVFPAWGIWAALQLILTDRYAIFLG